eukprot:6510657-Prymnesium_polylepis.1
MTAPAPPPRRHEDRPCPYTVVFNEWPMADVELGIPRGGLTSFVSWPFKDFCYHCSASHTPLPSLT